MRSKSDCIKVIRAHADELRSRYGITSLWLFGSVARDEHHEGSDVDLFAKMPSRFFNYIAAAQYLELILGCHVDLIQDHKNLRPFFRNQIEKDGIIIFSTDAGSGRPTATN